MDIEETARIAVDCGFHIHRDLGPGLLETVYEAVLAASLTRRGIAVERQKPLPLNMTGFGLPRDFELTCSSTEA